MRFISFKFFAFAVLILLCTASARAELLTFEMHWASPHGLLTRADGHVTIEVTKQDDGSYIGGADVDTVKNFSLTISNAIYGNGTFTELRSGDQDGMYPGRGFIAFNAAAGIDFTKDLVGQSQFQAEGGGPYSGHLAGFFLWSPLGRSFYYQTTTYAQWWAASDELMLSSLKVMDYYVTPNPVPEPQVLVMMLAGLGLTAAAARRRRPRPAA